MVRKLKLIGYYELTCDKEETIGLHTVYPVDQPEDEKNADLE